MSKAKRDVSPNSQSVESDPVLALIADENRALAAYWKAKEQYDKNEYTIDDFVAADDEYARASLLVEACEPTTLEGLLAKLEREMRQRDGGRDCPKPNYVRVAKHGTLREVQHAANILCERGDELRIMLRAFKAILRRQFDQSNQAQQSAPQIALAA